MEIQGKYRAFLIRHNRRYVSKKGKKEYNSIFYIKIARSTKQMSGRKYTYEHYFNRKKNNRQLTTEIGSAAIFFSEKSALKVFRKELKNKFIKMP